MDEEDENEGGCRRCECDPCVCGFAPQVFIEEKPLNMLQFHLRCAVLTGLTPAFLAEDPKFLKENSLEVDVSKAIKLADMLVDYAMATWYPEYKT